MKKFCQLVLGMVVISLKQAVAAYIITTPNTPIIESFTNFGITEPTNWTIAGTAIFIPPDSGSIQTAGIHSYGETGSSERALGYIGSASVPSIAFTAAFTNSTGTTIHQLDVEFRAEQWRSDFSRINGWVVSLSTDGGLNYDPINAGNLSTWKSSVEEEAGPIDGNVHSSLRSGSITGLSIPNGETFFLRWSADRGVPSGSSQGIAIDDVSVVASVPEPSMILLGSIAAICATVLRFIQVHRKAKA